MPRASSGLPEDLSLVATEHPRRVQPVTAIYALYYNGMALPAAKRAIEEVLVSKTAVVHLPTIEDFDKLISELASFGITARRVVDTQVDLKALRARLGLSQADFARRFALDIDTVQNWEQGRSRPDRAAQAYLRTIAAAPDVVAAAQVEPAA